MSNPILKVWTFPSDSNPDLEYQTLLYNDGSMSCNCKGWTRRVAEDGSRSCKHTRWVDLGLAHRHCTASHDYSTQPQPKPQTTNAKIKITHKLGYRKFAV